MHVKNLSLWLYLCDWSMDGLWVMSLDLDSHGKAVGAREAILKFFESNETCPAFAEEVWRDYFSLSAPPHPYV